VTEIGALNLILSTSAPQSARTFLCSHPHK